MKKIQARIVEGYKVASGTGHDKTFPKGTIEMQMPHFLKAGLPFADLSTQGTINLDISPHSLVMNKIDHDIRINWFEDLTEHFLFARAHIHVDEQTYHGFIYYPSPDTKPGHFQKKTTAELLMPAIAGIQYGQSVLLSCAAENLVES